MLENGEVICFIAMMTILNQRENALHSRLNALKFYFEQVLHREKFFVDIPRPKKHSQLPKTFTQKHQKYNNSLERASEIVKI